MIEAGIAFAREFLGDVYPPMPPDEPELVSGIFDAMIAVAGGGIEKPSNRRKERWSSLYVTSIPASDLPKVTQSLMAERARVLPRSIPILCVRFRFSWRLHYEAVS
jgi:hypothetical protein